MGQRVYIKAKPQALKKLNAGLKKLKINNNFTTEQNNIDWLNDINTDTKSPQAHLKPADRDLTMEELQNMLGAWTEVGLMSFDVAFSRTSAALAKKYAKFIEANKDSLEYIKGGDSFVDRFVLSVNQMKVLASLDKPEPDPEELPAEEKTHPTLQGGLFLCKSFSPQPFWVVFGNVERPVFLKVKKFKDDLYNSIYKDKKGHAYLLIPLLPLFGVGEKQLKFVEKLYNEAFQMGLRENFNFIIPFIYGLDVTSYYDVTKDYMESYSITELKQRFETVFAYVDATFHYGLPGGFRWSDAQKRFKCIGEVGYPLQAKCSVLTCLVWAMGEQAAAETMSKLTGKKYLAFEFNIKALNNI